MSRPTSAFVGPMPLEYGWDRREPLFIPSHFDEQQREMLCQYYGVVAQLVIRGVHEHPGWYQEGFDLNVKALNKMVADIGVRKVRFQLDQQIGKDGLPIQLTLSAIPDPAIETGWFLPEQTTSIIVTEPKRRMQGLTVRHGDDLYVVNSCDYYVHYRNVTLLSLTMGSWPEDIVFTGEDWFKVPEIPPAPRKKTLYSPVNPARTAP